MNHAFTFPHEDKILKIFFPIFMIILKTIEPIFKQVICSAISLKISLEIKRRNLNFFFNLLSATLYFIYRDLCWLPSNELLCRFFSQMDWKLIHNTEKFLGCLIPMIVLIIILNLKVANCTLGVQYSSIF